MIPNLYDLEAKGVDPREFLGRLQPPQRRKVLSSWEWRSRPGQRWKPGPEKITDYECGRGHGKTIAGSETICDLALDPERWGYAALIGGRDPTQVRRDCLEGSAGVFATARRRAEAGIGPAIVKTNYNDRVMHFEAPRGGGTGLVVYWAAASNPQSFRGLNLGFAWCDEFGVWDHSKRDDTGANAWKSLRPAVRIGKAPKILITQTPGFAPEIRQLQRDAERPECPTCKAVHLANGKWTGEPGLEPWRLPRGERRLVHPLLATRTTNPIRTCPICKSEIIAEVRLVTGATLDNPFLAEDARSLAVRALEGGSQAARFEFDPQGESDSAPSGNLIQTDNLIYMDLHVPALDGDRWQSVLHGLGAQRVIVFVDPAVTGGDNADDTGLVVSCIRNVTGPDGVTYEQVVTLQDDSIRGTEVQGAPSSVWAPRALWLAQKWGADSICIEVNQGGEETLQTLRSLQQRSPVEQDIEAKIAKELNRPPGIVRGQPSLIPATRRMMAAGINVRIESVHRRSGKPARWGWYGESASRKEQALHVAEWLDGKSHWIPALAQANAYDPGRKGKDKRDRMDAIIGAAQILLGVSETKTGIKQQEPLGWMHLGVDRLFG